MICKSLYHSNEWKGTNILLVNLFFISGLVLFDLTTGSVLWATDNRNRILSENDEYEKQSLIIKMVKLHLTHAFRKLKCPDELVYQSSNYCLDRVLYLVDQTLPMPIASNGLIALFTNLLLFLELIDGKLKKLLPWVPWVSFVNYLWNFEKKIHPVFALLSITNFLQKKNKIIWRSISNYIRRLTKN